MTGTELITLTALMEALSINNPCHHTGLESFVCEDCGYPDPRKIIAALKAERDALKDWKESALEVEGSWDVQELAKERSVDILTHGS